MNLPGPVLSESKINLFTRYYDRYLTYVVLKFIMSDTSESNENIETAQKNQKKIGAAEDDPETTGPAENLREEAAEMVDKDEDSNEPA